MVDLPSYPIHNHHEQIKHSVQFQCLAFLLLILSGQASGIRRRLLNITSRIVGGTPANVTRYPYYAYVGFTHVGLQQYSQCGGTLIHEDIVLTAAHCYPGPSATNQGASFVYVSYTNKKAVSGYYPALISSIVPHPLFNAQTYQNDLLIIKLNKRLTQVTPVQLNSDSSVPADGTVETLIGFGTTSEGAQTSSVLRKVKLRAVSFKNCALAYGGSQIVNSLMTCSYFDGKDACQGDSGGPLLITEDTAASDLQVGIISFGHGCAQANIPGVNTRVSTYYAWIQSKICALSASPPKSCSSTASKTQATAPTKKPVAM